MAVDILGLGGLRLGRAIVTSGLGDATPSPAPVVGYAQVNIIALGNGLLGRALVARGLGSGVTRGPLIAYGDGLIRVPAASDTLVQLRVAKG